MTAGTQPGPLLSSFPSGSALRCAPLLLSRCCCNQLAQPGQLTDIGMCLAPCWRLGAPQGQQPALGLVSLLPASAVFTVLQG